MRTKRTEWTVVDEPAAATKATKTKAAASGVRHVVTSVHASLATSTTVQTPLSIQLKDGSTVIATWAVAAGANGQGGVSLDDVCYPCSLSTAVTLEFSAAGVADSIQRITLGGYSTT